MEISIPEEIMERTQAVNVFNFPDQGLGFEIRDKDDLESEPIFRYRFEPFTSDIFLAVSITREVCLYIHAWKQLNE